MTIQVDDSGQPLVAALQFPVYRLSEFDWKKWTPASRFYYTQFIGIDDTATPVVYSLRYCIPGVAGGVGQVSSNTLEDFQAEIADVLARQDRIDLDVADLLAQVNSLLTTAQDVAAQAQSSVTSSAQSAASASDSATKAQTWAEGEDAAVVELGGAHSSKGWAGEAESHATAAHNDYVSMTTDANVVAVGSHIDAVNTVATNMSDVNTVVTNLAAIQDAPNQAASANNSKIEAQSSANAAQTMAEQAGQSATSAAQSAQTAQTMATQAAQSAQAAEDKADEASESARLAVSALSLQIGDVCFAPLGIDETLNLRRYLNGQVISQSQFVSFTNKVKSAITLYPNLATTEANWQAEKAQSKLGQCGKFVVDDTAGTIRLPCVVNAQGLVDLSLIGGIKSESLPNHYHENFANESGAGNVITATTSPISSNTENGWGAAIMRSGSNLEPTIGKSSGVYGSSTYQNGAPVQQEAVQYPYCIVVATGVEETLPAIREYKVNNSDFFGKSMYSDIAPNNASWLASNGQWNAKSVYPDYYDWLVGQMNAGVSGFVASTATYTDYDFVINTADQTFRLPLIAGRVLVAKKEATAEDATWYNLYSDGWCEQGGLRMFTNVTTTPQQVNIVLLKTMRTYSASICPIAVVGDWGAGSYAITSTSGTNFHLDAYSFRNAINTVTIDWQVFGYSAEVPTQADYTEVKGLYFYVGDTVQDASLINAGAVLSDIADLKAGKANTDLSNCTKPYVTETYRNGNNWYRVWSDGWIEQGSMSTAVNGTSGVSFVINYFIPFSVGDNQMIIMTPFEPDTNDTGSNLTIIGRTANNFTGVNVGYGRNPLVMSWYACGY